MQADGGCGDDAEAQRHILEGRVKVLALDRVESFARLPIQNRIESYRTGQDGTARDGRSLPERGAIAGASLMRDGGRGEGDGSSTEARQASSEEDRLLQGSARAGGGKGACEVRHARSASASHQHRVGLRAGIWTYLKMPCGRRRLAMLTGSVGASRGSDEAPELFEPFQKVCKRRLTRLLPLSR